MANLRKLWVIHTTADIADADTEDRFNLLIKSVLPTPGEPVRIPFPDLPNPDERERARTDEYAFDVANLKINMELTDGNDIGIQTS